MIVDDTPSSPFVPFNDVAAGETFKRQGLVCLRLAFAEPNAVVLASGLAFTATNDEQVERVAYKAVRV